MAVRVAKEPLPQGKRRRARVAKRRTRQPDGPGSLRPSREQAPKDAKTDKARSSAPPRNVRRAQSEAAATGPSVIGRLRVRDRLRGAAHRLRAALSSWRRPLIVSLRVVGVLLALAGAVGVGRLVQQHLKTSEAFATRAIELSGAQRIEREELLDTAGLAEGQNVFEVSPELAEARLAGHPWVASAEVTRRLPGHYTIAIREQRAVALLVVETCADDLTASADEPCEDRPASSLYLVSEEGTVFKRLEGEDPVDLPVITGVPRQRFGTDPEFRSSILLEAVALLHEYRAAGLWRRMPIAEIHLEPDDGFSLYSGEDLTHVRLGKPPFQRKLRRMRKVLDRLDSEEASAAYVYLDNARHPDRVTVRLR